MNYFDIGVSFLASLIISSVYYYFQSEEVVYSHMFMLWVSSFLLVFGGISLSKYTVKFKTPEITDTSLPPSVVESSSPDDVLTGQPSFSTR